jgi:broad specificity phosphatase PhoE
MEFLLVRHALPVSATVDDGHADPHLSVLGVAQATALARSGYLGVVDGVITSPQRRAVETARPIAERYGLTPTVVDDVAEWDVGTREYHPVEELKASGHPAWEAIARGEPYGDIDIPAFRRRVVDAFNALAEANPGRRLVVATHAGVINVFIADVLGLRGSPTLWFAPGYASLSRVAVSRDGRRGVLSLNETGHLLAVAAAPQSAET